MKKYILVTFLLTIGFWSNSQNDSLFGEKLFIAIQQDTTDWTHWYITLEEYHQLIERQNMSKSSKDEFKISVNESYKVQFDNFIEEMNSLRDSYSIEQEDAHYELVKVETEPLEQVKDIYYFRLYIEFHWKKRRESYVLEFQAAQLNGQWIMMEPLQEYHQ